MALNVTVQGPEKPEESKYPALVMMHFLGGSTREWDEVVALLGPEYKTVRIDLPGFGGSAGETGYTVSAMADAVHEAVCAAGVEEYVLVGHSMSGKVSMVLARRAQDAGFARAAEKGCSGGLKLRGLVLVAPSPPSPEPMTEEKRSGMIASLGGAPAEGDFARALKYITRNEERDIRPAVEERAAREVLRMNRTAWVAWVTGGSKEDWAERVGVLTVPALVVAGEKDASLGPKQQRELTLPHLGKGKISVVKGCSHLVPMERPEAMAEMLREFCAALPVARVPEEYVEFLDGERVSEPTKAVLRARMDGPPVTDGLLNAAQQRTLRAMLARVVPQVKGEEIDLVGFVLARLATGKGDGWRYAVLPEDAQAYREGLDRLIEKGFEEMDVEQQDTVLSKLAAKAGSVDARWFEEVRGDAVTAYAGHPATLARWGYSGFGVGGAYTKFRGFVDFGVNSRETWEPVAIVPAGAEKDMEVTR